MSPPRPPPAPGPVAPPQGAEVSPQLCVNQTRQVRGEGSSRHLYVSLGLRFSARREVTGGCSRLCRPGSPSSP